MKAERPPKVAVFLEYFPPYMGSDRRIFELCRASQGVVNYLMIATPPLRFLAGRGERGQHAARNIFARKDEHVESDGLSGFKLGMPNVIQRIWTCNMPFAYLVSFAWFSLKAFSFVRRSGAGLVVVAHPSYLCGGIGVFVARILRKPILLDCPDVWTPMAKEVMGLNASSIRLRVLHQIEASIARCADTVVAATPYIKNYFARLGVSPEKIKVLPNGVDTDRFVPSVISSVPQPETGVNRVIIFVGRLERWVGFEALVKAAGFVVAKRPNSLFVIVGDGTMKRDFEMMAAQSGLKDKFLFLGFQPDNLVPDLISGSDVAVSLFSNDVVSDASLPLKLFEYMSAGKAVVATAQQGVIETIKNRDIMLVAKPEDHSGLANSILTLLDNPKVAVEMGQKARAFVIGDFSWKSLSKKFEEFCLLVKS